jgi:tetratricopeptide (TPR) repeat protein
LQIANCKLQIGRYAPRGKWRLVALAVLAVGVAGGFYAWRREPAPVPPSVDLEDADPEVVRAIETARAAVLATPRSGMAWGRLGMVFAVHDFDAPARTCFLQAERFDPADFRWPYLHGMMQHIPAPHEALPLLQRAADRAASESAPRLLLAETLLEQNRLDEAEPYFRGVPETDPQRGRACLGLARLASNRDDPQSALEALRKAVEYAPEAKPVRTLLAEVYHRLGDDKAAHEELRLLAELPDDFSWPDPIMEQMWQLRAGVQAHITYAGRCLQQGRHSEAADVLRQTVRDHPASYDAWLALGRGLLQVRASQGTADALRQAVRLRPAAFEAHFYLGAALHQENNLRAAAEQYRQALTYKSHHAIAHYNLGICYRDLNDPDQAIAAFREAVRCKPDLAAGHRELGALLVKSGHDAEALPHLQAAVRLAPHDDNAAKLLEEVQKRMRTRG